nr:transposase, MuDR, MULE transposase domain protein [Tanacetum cinerariifolium]
MLDELGLGSSVLLLSHFRIPCESLDDGLVTLIGDEDVLTLLKYVPKFREIKEKGMLIKEILKDNVFNGQHKRKEMSVKGKNVVIEEIAGDFFVGKVQNVCTSLVASSIGKNLNLLHSDDCLLMDYSPRSGEGKKNKTKNYIALAFHDILRNIDFEFGNKGDKIKKKVSQDSVIVEEDFDDTISDTEGEESDLQTFFKYDDASVSGLSSDFPS